MTGTIKNEITLENENNIKDEEIKNFENNTIFFANNEINNEIGLENEPLVISIVSNNSNDKNKIDIISIENQDDKNFDFEKEIISIKTTKTTSHHPKKDGIEEKDPDLISTTTTTKKIIKIKKTRKKDLPPEYYKRKYYRLKRRRILNIISNIFKTVILLFLITLIVASTVLLFIPDSPTRVYLMEFLKWIDEIPEVYGSIIVVFLYAFSLCFMFPGTPFNLAAGFLFRIWLGSLVAVLGAVLGSVFAFLLGRTLLRSFVTKFVNKNRKFRAIDRAVQNEGFKLILLTRLSPVFPFPVLNYFFGATKVGFWKYLLATTLGILPFTIIYTYFGTVLRDLTEIFNSIQDQGWEKFVMIGFGIVTTIAVLIFVLVLTRRALKKAMKEYDDQSLNSKDKHSPDSEDEYEEYEEEFEIDDDQQLDGTKTKKDGDKETTTYFPSNMDCTTASISARNASGTLEEKQQLLSKPKMSKKSKKKVESLIANEPIGSSGIHTTESKTTTPKKSKKFSFLKKKTLKKDMNANLTMNNENLHYQAV